MYVCIHVHVYFYIDVDAFQERACMKFIANSWTESVRHGSPHAMAVCATTAPLFGDRDEFSKVLLLGFGLPPIRCSAHTRIAPTAQQMQAAYDVHLAPIFGQREWVDTGEMEGEHCIFIQGHRQRLGLSLWVLVAMPSFPTIRD